MNTAAEYRAMADECFEWARDAFACWQWRAVAARDNV
jgi:hypothetical protein